MPNIKSAKKRVLVNQTKAARNKALKSNLKTMMKTANQAVEAKEGVEVRVIYDDVGSWKLPKRYIKEMQAAGIQIYPFLPVRFPYSRIR